MSSGAIIIPFPCAKREAVVCDHVTVLTLSDQIAEIVSAHLRAEPGHIFEALEALARQVAFIIVPAETEFDGVADWFGDALYEKIEEFSGELQEILEREEEAP
jgi:hypothetical protein